MMEEEPKRCAIESAKKALNKHSLNILALSEKSKAMVANQKKLVEKLRQKLYTF